MWFNTAFKEARETEYLYKSYPAASGEPRVGNLAFSDSLLTRSWDEGTCCAESDILRFFSCGSTSTVMVGVSPVTRDATCSWADLESVSTPT